VGCQRVRRPVLLQGEDGYGEGRAVGGVELPGHKLGLDQPRLDRLEEDV